MTPAERARARNELRKKEEPLFAELRPFVRKNMLRHPLVIEADLDPDHAALVNARFREVSKEVKEALEKKDYSRYIDLHERPYRLDALVECADFGLCGPDFWRCVRDVWVDSENIHQSRGKWRKVWRSQEPGMEECMDDNERAALADLPGLVRVWRGTTYQRSIRDISWTTDRDKARWFATRFTATNSLVAEGTVAKTDIKAIFLQRGESEVISLRVKIEKMTKMTDDGSACRGDDLA
jgi:hypothetical protein